MSERLARVTLSPRKIQQLYDRLSSVYDLVTHYEVPAIKRALEILALREGFRVLEVGFGTGRATLEIAKKVGNTGEVCGLDASIRMMSKANKRLRGHGLNERVDLAIGDVHEMPYLDSIFDVTFSSYLLDLIDTENIPRVLSEFRRVLKSGGRIVLISLSKGERWYDDMRLYEWIYARSPSLLGGCRPVLLKPCLQQVGFKNTAREFIHAGHLMPSEIVWAERA
jgi:ubiquinone/menaquinone biosynthesis C-methylase UbiE